MLLWMVAVAGLSVFLQDRGARYDRRDRPDAAPRAQAAGISASIWLLNLEVWEGRARVSAGREGADRKARPQPSPSPRH